MCRTADRGIERIRAGTASPANGAAMNGVVSVGKRLPEKERLFLLSTP